MIFFVSMTGVLPGLWKADIDSAFRRIPVAPCDRWLCGFVFMIASQVTFVLLRLLCGVYEWMQGVVGKAQFMPFWCHWLRTCVGTCRGCNCAYCACTAQAASASLL